VSACVYELEIAGESVYRIVAMTIRVSYESIGLENKRFHWQLVRMTLTSVYVTTCEPCCLQLSRIHCTPLGKNDARKVPAWTYKNIADFDAFSPHRITPMRSQNWLDWQCQLQPGKQLLGPK